MQIKRYHVILGLIGLVIAMGIVGQSDFEEAERQQAEYCEMVKLWSIIEFGLGGYVVGRSVEKIAPSIASAMKR